MRRRWRMAISECPVCTFHIPLPDGMSEGEEMICPDCGAGLKLVKRNPPIFEEIREE